MDIIHSSTRNKDGVHHVYNLDGNSARATEADKMKLLKRVEAAQNRLYGTYDSVKVKAAWNDTMYYIDCR